MPLEGVFSVFVLKKYLRYLRFLRETKPLTAHRSP